MCQMGIDVKALPRVAGLLLPDSIKSSADGFVVKVASGDAPACGLEGRGGGRNSVEVRFSAADGLSIWAGSEALVADLKPCFYRAPTDNDRGGSCGSSYASRCALCSEPLHGACINQLLNTP